MPRRRCPRRRTRGCSRRSDCATGCARTTVSTSTGRPVSFVVPELPYPSTSSLTVTVTDAQGLTGTATRQLEPRTTGLTFKTSPGGGVTTEVGSDHAAPYTQTFVTGAHVHVSVPDDWFLNGANYHFTSWSDGGGARPRRRRCRRRQRRSPRATRDQNRLPTAVVTANPASGPRPTRRAAATTATDPDGDDTAFTYAWALDDDGVFDDGGGADSELAPYSGLGANAIHGAGHRQPRWVLDDDDERDRHQQRPDSADHQDTITGRGQRTSLGDASAAPRSSDLDGGAISPTRGTSTATAPHDDASTATPTRTYSSSGPVQVSLKVTDNEGATNTTAKTVTIANRAPTAAFTFTPAAPTVGPDRFSSTVNLDRPRRHGRHLRLGPRRRRRLRRCLECEPNQDLPPARQRPGLAQGDRQQGRHCNASRGPVPVGNIIGNQGPQAELQLHPRRSEDRRLGPVHLQLERPRRHHRRLRLGPRRRRRTTTTATGATATRVYQIGTVTARLKVTDADGSSATTTRTVTATNTAPTVTRVTAYPAGLFSIGQTLGFDAAATDPQETLSSTAYSFVVQRQDCASGCPRVEVQRWTGTMHRSVRRAGDALPVAPLPSGDGDGRAGCHRFPRAPHRPAAGAPQAGRPRVRTSRSRSTASFARAAGRVAWLRGRW